MSAYYIPDTVQFHTLFDGESVGGRTKRFEPHSFLSDSKAQIDEERIYTK